VLCPKENHYSCNLFTVMLFSKNKHFLLSKINSIRHYMPINFMELKRRKEKNALNVDVNTLKLKHAAYVIKGGLGEIKPSRMKVSPRDWDYYF